MWNYVLYRNICMCMLLFVGRYILEVMKSTRVVNVYVAFGICIVHSDI